MMNKGKLGMVGVAAVAALVLVYRADNRRPCPGHGPWPWGIRDDGRSTKYRTGYMMQGSVITSTTPLAPAQAGCGYGPQGQGGCGGFGPGMMGMMQGNGSYGRGQGMMGGITGMMRGWG